MTDIRHEWDNRIRDWPTIRRIASDLGLTGEGHHFFCPGCQPLQTGKPELAIGDGHFECFRCGDQIACFARGLPEIVEGGCEAIAVAAALEAYQRSSCIVRRGGVIACKAIGHSHPV